MTTCAPLIHDRRIDPEMLTRAVGHLTGMNTAVQRVYHRACDAAVNNSYDLISVIPNDEGSDKNSTVKAAAEHHRNDLAKFQRGEVDRNVPYESNKKLIESIAASELIHNPDVREKAKQSSWWWSFVKNYGGLTVLSVIIIGIFAAKR